MVGNGANLLHTSGTPSVVISTLVEGTKENAVCSNRGICNTETGTCTCAEGFASSDGNGNIGLRGDCGYATTEIVHCPGDIECSNHGVCSEKPSYTCECSYGWTGADCSQRVCNSGKAWFDMPSATDTAHDTAECSNAGTCDRRRGDCLCSAGFSGGSCNRLDCPKDCNNQGTCNTMEEIARDTTLNGDETSWTYGETPNKIQVLFYRMQNLQLPSRLGITIWSKAVSAMLAGMVIPVLQEHALVAMMYSPSKTVKQVLAFNMMKSKY